VDLISPQTGQVFVHVIGGDMPGELMWRSGYGFFVIGRCAPGYAVRDSAFREGQEASRRC
jgi:hypothetical protein